MPILSTMPLWRIVPCVPEATPKYFFSTELYLKAYVQWNDDKVYNFGKEKIISNLLLRWIYSPESNLYLVYNDGRLVGPGESEIVNRTFMVKATFFWRK